MKKGKDSRELRRALNIDSLDSKFLSGCSDIRKRLVSDPIRLGMKLKDMSLQNILCEDPRLPQIESW